MKLKLFLLLYSINIYSTEFSINSYEETILSIKDEIVATNCSPNNLGLVSSLQTYNTKSKRHLLKFTPTGKSGSIVCSAVTKNNGIMSSVFSLRKGVNNPIVEIPLTPPTQRVDNLTEFSHFIKNNTEGLTKINTSGIVSTSSYSYKFLEKHQSSAGIYLYKIKVTPLSKEKGFEKLKMISSQILYSHHKDTKFNELQGLSKNNPSYLYLMTRNSVDLNTIHNYLR